MEIEFDERELVILFSALSQAKLVCNFDWIKSVENLQQKINSIQSFYAKTPEGVCNIKVS